MAATIASAMGCDVRFAAAIRKIILKLKRYYLNSIVCIQDVGKMPFLSS
jgi:hypothetical protein